MSRTDRPDPRRLAHCEPQSGKTLLWRILTPLLPGPRRIAKARAPRLAGPANLAARKNVRTGGVRRRTIFVWSPRHLAQCIVKELPPPRIVLGQSRRRHQFQQCPWIGVGAAASCGKDILSVVGETLRESPSARVFCSPRICRALHANPKCAAKN